MFNKIVRKKRERKQNKTIKGSLDTVVTLLIVSVLCSHDHRCSTKIEPYSLFHKAHKG